MDDDASTREVVAAVLERTGADVRVTASAAEGWNALHDRTPDVLIADLAMPVEDGFSFMRRVRDNSMFGERLRRSHCRPLPTRAPKNRHGLPVSRRSWRSGAARGLARPDRSAY
jgi:CheY-like chemotaxis protein